ncbi:hypothetical protein F5878DRAFT_639100 [Lentinula raphanica]|uniref:Uncharacterized protein n=1 Tax=Lentinula raphanica TaxID=153919 RepID=A0AA38PFQ0_9AGAR|nr:hypothetical protein F5878DRAFT_639100 [Lentinula raphanica]
MFRKTDLSDSLPFDLSHLPLHVAPLISPVNCCPPINPISSVKPNRNSSEPGVWEELEQKAEAGWNKWNKGHRGAREEEKPRRSLSTPKSMTVSLTIPHTRRPSNSPTKSFFTPRNALAYVESSFENNVEEPSPDSLTRSSRSAIVVSIPARPPTPRYPLRLDSLGVCAISGARLRFNGIGMSRRRGIWSRIAMSDER